MSGKLWGVRPPADDPSRCGSCGNCLAALKNEDLRVRIPGITILGEYRCTGMDKKTALRDRKVALNS